MGQVWDAILSYN